MVDDRLLEIFVEEARDLARRLLSSAVQLETADTRAERLDRMAEILRDLHTMKGSAGSVDAEGPRSVAKAVHEIEDRLKAAGEAGAEDEALLDALIDDLTAVQAGVDRIAAGDLHTPVARPSAAAQAAPAPAAGPATVSPMEGLHLFAEDDASPAAASPAPPEQRQATPRTPSAAPPAADNADARHSEPLKIRPERIDAVHAVAGELVVSRLQTEALTTDLVALRDLGMQASLTWRALQGELRQHRRTLGDAWAMIEPKVQTLQGQLTDLRNHSTGLARQATSLRDRSSALIGSLDERIRSLRLMPVQPFLEELLPVAREAAKLAKRRVRLVPDGGDAEIDRQVLATLREPLLHMVRNAVVHGIEPADDRERASKSRTGTITLRARCEGPRIRISVVDDGRGVDAEAVLARGREEGIVGPEAPADPATLLRILVHPGFSTAGKVDGLAGRGVGMDVVHQTIQKLGGTLDLEFEPGRGATFTVDVPISTSTTAGLVVEVGEGRFGLPLLHIERVVRLTRDDLVSGERHPFVHIDGKPIAVAPLGPFVGHPFAGLGPDKSPAIVVKARDERLALIVDDIAGQREMLVKALPPAFGEHELLIGGAVEADGSVLQVLDAPALVSRVERDGVQALPLIDAPDRPEVLVVDRSKPMQSLLRGVLTAAGFSVTGATDAEGARAHLGAKAFRLVVVDPRVPGIDAPALCEELSTRTDTTSMVLLSFDVEACHAAMQAGAAAFVDKRTFSQAAFLDVAREHATPATA